MVRNTRQPILYLNHHLHFPTSIREPLLHIPQLHDQAKYGVTCSCGRNPSCCTLWQFVQESISCPEVKTIHGYKIAYSHAFPYRDMLNLYHFVATIYVWHPVQRCTLARRSQYEASQSKSHLTVYF